MVNELADIAEQDFKDKIRDETSMLRDYFVRRTQKFDGKYRGAAGIDFTHVVDLEW